MSNILVARIVYVFLDSSFLYVAKDFRPKRAIRQLRSAIKNITPGNRHAILGQLILLVKFFHDRNLAINNINYKSIFKVPVDPEFLRSPEREQYIQIRLYDAFFAFQNGLRFSQDIQLIDDYREYTGNSFLMMSFLSPEQREDDHLSLKTNDIWALGVMALYLYRAEQIQQNAENMENQSKLKEPYNQFSRLVTTELAQTYLVSN